MQKRFPTRRNGARVIVSVGSALLVLVSGVVATSTAAEAATAKENCVINTHGVDREGNLIYSKDDVKCYSTFGEAMRSTGAENVSDDTTPSDVVSGDVALRGSILGIHYEHGSGTGASMTTTGSVCGGGGLNVPTSFNDRITSTYNGCNTITHWENSGYSGSSFSTFGVNNVTDITGYMDDRTSSIRYYS